VGDLFDHLQGPAVVLGMAGAVLVAKNLLWLMYGIRTDTPSTIMFRFYGIMALTSLHNCNYS
jgi:hypothetical protein